MLTGIDRVVSCKKKFHIFEIFHNQLLKNEELIILAIKDIGSEQDRINNLFQEKILLAISMDERTGIGLMQSYDAVLNNKEEDAINSKEWVLSAAFFSNSMATGFFESGSVEDAFDQLFDVSFYLRMLDGFGVTEVASLKQRKQISQKALESRHKGNREMKEYVVQFYKENYKSFKNKDVVASHLEEKIPYAFSTIRGWLKGIKTS